MPVYFDKKTRTYFFTVRVTDNSGKVKQVKRRGFEKSKLAKVAEAEFILQSENEIENTDTMTFGEVADLYLEWYQKRRKESSYNKVKSVINNNILPKFKTKVISKIRNRDITKFHDWLLEQGYSAHHTKKIHTTLSAVFKFGIREEYIQYNPASAVGNLDVEDERLINYWTLEEFKQFIMEVDDQQFHAFFMTLYYSGMRKGEALALTWNDLDFNSNTVSITKTAYNRKITTTKTQSSRRTVILPSHTMRLLSQLKAAKKYYKPDYVVFGEFHDHMSTSTLDRYFEKYTNKAGIKKIRIHDFRHSHASYLINQNAIPSMIAQRLGHSDVGTTLNIYSHLYPSTEKEAVLRMENDFKKASIYNFR